MSLSKNQFEHMRLYAQKCDHRLMAPEACFDLAADLRARKDRGGKMFEKRKQRTDKFAVDESNIQNPRSRQGSLPGPKHFAPPHQGPLPWSAATSAARTSKPVHHVEFLYNLNQNEAAAQEEEEEEDTVDNNQNLTDAERLRKLYRILGYIPRGEELPPIKAAQVPRVDLKTQSSLAVPALQGRDFNRNARGWNAGDSDIQQRASVPARPSQLSVEADYVDYNQVNADPEPQGILIQATHKPRPKSWHAVTFQDPPRDDEVLLAGDYNPRPKAWQPMSYQDSEGPEEVLQYGDYNLKAKPWTSQEGEAVDLVSPMDEVPFGDYNPRPKAWQSNKPRKSRSKMRCGDYNARPRAWQSSEGEHYQGEGSEPKGETKFGDYNPRPKAWKSAEAEHLSVDRGQVRFGDYNPRPKAWRSRSSGSQGVKVRGGDYNPRPKAWRSAPEDDSSSTTSSYSSSGYSDDDDYSYASTPYSRSSIPACDV